MTKQQRNDMGLRIKLRRTALRLKQVELAKAVGISQTSMSDCERGKFTVSIDTLSNIATALKTTMCELLGEEARKKAA